MEETLNESIELILQLRRIHFRGGDIGRIIDDLCIINTRTFHSPRDRGPFVCIRAGDSNSVHRK